MQVDASLVLDYLTGRLQYVRLQHCMSDQVISNTGTTGSLFTLYTTDISHCTETLIPLSTTDIDLPKALAFS